MILQLVVGMVLNKKSIIKMLGHKYFNQKFHQIFDIFKEKFSMAFNIMVRIFNWIANFETMSLRKLLMNFE